MRLPFDGSFSLTQTFANKLIIGGVDIYAQYGLRGHNGLDYGLPTGTKVLAPHSGKVIEAFNDPNGYGNYIKIENSVEGSVLAHLQSFAVSLGQEIKEGQLIGISNNTGNSTGPHLHWGYYKFPRDRANGYGGFINQLPLIPVPVPPAPIPIITSQTKILAALLGTTEDMEVQAIKSKLGELASVHTQLTQERAKTATLQAKIDKAKSDLM